MALVLIHPSNGKL